MGAKQGALMLCPEPPYPLAGGGAMRTASLVEYLAPRYELDVIAFRQPGMPDPASGRLGELARRVTVIDLADHGRHVPARAFRNLGRLWRGVPPLTDRYAGAGERVHQAIAGRRYRLAIIEHFWCAGYAGVLDGACDRLMLDLHNVESVLHRGCAESERWPLSYLHRKFEMACRGLEERYFGDFSLLLTASERDAARVRRIRPAASVAVYPNTIPRLDPPRTSRENVIAFSANMEYHPNTAAVRHFRDAIWPQLRDRWPGLVWRLVGKNPEAVAKIIAGDPRIETTGRVEDAVRELAKAKVAVVPLRAGSGTRIKILEAWAAKTPVVSTTIGAEGIPANHGHDLLIADQPGQFVAAVDSLLQSEETRLEVGRAGRALYERNFTWEAGWRGLQNLDI